MPNRVTLPYTGRRRGAQSSSFRLISLVIQRKNDHKPPHDIIYFEIRLRAVGMRVVAPDAHLCDSPVCVDRAEKLLPAATDDAGIGAIWMHLNRLRPRRSNSVAGAFALLIGH